MTMNASLSSLGPGAIAFIGGGNMATAILAGLCRAGAPASLAGRPIEILAFTEAGETVEGAPPGSRVVVLRFPDKEAAMEWYHSPEYQAVVQFRLDGTEGFALLCDGM